MSATEIPLVTPDALNKILTRENDELRMRERIGKEAFDKMRADLAARDALIGELRTTGSAIVAEYYDPDTQRRRGCICQWEDLLTRTPTDAVPLVLGHPATRDWCEAVDAHHAATEQALDALRAQLATAEARVRELEKTWNAAQAFHVKNEADLRKQAEARLAAVLRAADAMRTRCAKLAGVLGCYEIEAYDAARTGDLHYSISQVRGGSDAPHTYSARTGDEANSNLVPFGSKLEPAAHPDSVKLAAVIRGLTAVEALIGDSFGVAGLHLNGDVAPWAELRSGGRYERWLVDFDAALDAAKSGAGVDVVTRSELIAMLGDLAKLRCHVLRYGPAGHDLYSSVDVAALLEDKARLDWLEVQEDDGANTLPHKCTSERGHVYFRNRWVTKPGDPGHYAEWDHTYAPTIRAAIDAARKEGSK